MSVILIDSNIWLEFYASSKLKELLPLLIDYKEHLCITGQIVKEVQRNRLRRAKKFLDASYPQKAPKIGVPGHLLALEEKTQKRIESFNNEAESITRDLQGLYLEVLKLIATGTDCVSVELSKLFQDSIDATKDEIDRAHYRELVGNPPGKPNDPLGDQLTWEQYLSRAAKSSKFWIITRDRDYYDTLFGDVIAINPLLLRDLTDRAGKEVEARCFQTLAAGMKDFAAIHPPPPKTLPAEETIAEIQKEEEQISSYYPFGEPGPPAICLNCQAKNSFTSGGYLRSRFGGLTLQYVCRNCGFHLDTGDFYD
jgi:hypothetical protein